MNKDLSQSQARNSPHLKALPALGKVRFEGMDLEWAGVKAQGVQRPLEQELKAGRGHRIKPVSRPEIKVREGLASLAQGQIPRAIERKISPS